MDNEQRLIEPERRRRRGARLPEAGVAQAEVARRVGVTRTSVSRWEKVRQEGGAEALRRPKRFGRPRRLSEEQCAELIRQLNRSPSGPDRTPSSRRPTGNFDAFA